MKHVILLVCGVLCFISTTFAQQDSNIPLEYQSPIGKRLDKPYHYTPPAASFNKSTLSPTTGCNLINNPGMEDIAQPHTPPTGWVNCNNTTTDTYNTGMWDATVSPHGGNTCLGLAGDPLWEETASQTLPTCLLPGHTYVLSFWMTTSNIDLSSVNRILSDGQLVIYGDTPVGANCNNTYVLWTSPSVSTIPHWQQYYAVITPPTTIWQLTIQVKKANPNAIGIAYLLVDDFYLSPNIECRINQVQGVTCGSTNGFIDISTNNNACEPITYLWSNGETTQDLNNLDAGGNYTLWATDALGYIDTISVTVPNINANNTFNATATTSYSQCNANTGAVDISVGGGSPPYTYHWSTGATSQDLSSLAANTYSVTISDQSLCQTYVSATVNTLPIEVHLNIAQAINCLHDGIIETQSIGTGTLNYAWSTGEQTANINVSTSNLYSVTVADTYGCTASASIIITRPPSPPYYAGLADANSEFYCQGDSIKFFVFTTDWTSGFDSTSISIQWITPSGDTLWGNNIYLFETGVYQISVIDTNHCQHDITTNIQYSDPFPLIISQTPFLCPNEATTIYAPNGYYTQFSWQEPDGTLLQGDSITVNQVGTYTIIGSVSGGCADTTTFTVRPVSLSLSDDRVICNTDTANLNAILNLSSNEANGCEKYTVHSISYAPYNAPPNTIADSVLSPSLYQVTIPFHFNFFCQSIDTISVYREGFLSLGNNDPSYLYPSFIPLSNTVNNVIAFCWNSRISYEGSYSHWVEGTAPYRKLVISLNHIRYYEGNGYFDGQIVLCETTDDIEMHINKMIPCDPRQTQGIENGLGTVAYAVPGHNYTLWSANHESWVFRRTPPNPFIYTWQPATDLSTPNTSYTIASPSETTTYTVNVTNGYCDFTDSVSVTVNPLPLVEAWIRTPAQDSAHIFINQTVTAGLLSPLAGQQYTWQTPLLSGNTNSPEVELTPGILGTYPIKLIVTSAEGCVASDSVLLVVDPSQIALPSAFTPNADGTNDVFRPSYIGNPEVEYFKIYDRWGKLIYDNPDIINSAWDGTYQGEALPRDSYIYTLKIKPDNSPDYMILKGSVVLVR